MTTQTARGRLVEGATGNQYSTRKEPVKVPVNSGAETGSFTSTGPDKVPVIHRISTSLERGVETLKESVNSDVNLSHCAVDGCPVGGQWVASFVTLAEWERLALCGVHAVQLELTHARLAGLRFTNMATGRVVAPLPAEIAWPVAVR